MLCVCVYILSSANNLYFMYVVVWIEIEHHSVVYFNCVAVFEVLWCRTSVKTGLVLVSYPRPLFPPPTWPGYKASLIRATKMPQIPDTYVSPVLNRSSVTQRDVIESMTE